MKQGKDILSLLKNIYSGNKMNKKNIYSGNKMNKQVFSQERWFDCPILWTNL